MIITRKQDICLNCNAVIIPFTAEKKLMVSLPGQLGEAVEKTLESQAFSGECGSLTSFHLYQDGLFILVLLVGIGEGIKAANRDIFLAFAKAFKKSKEASASKTMVILDNAGKVLESPKLMKKICELPFLVSYEFNQYKTSQCHISFEEVEFISDRRELDQIMQEAAVCGESAMLARDLVNHPSMFMTPIQLCREAKKVGAECKIEVEIFDRGQMEQFGMGAFLAVAKGAVDEPRFIVMRYQGGALEEKPLALVGKGVMFDSGGYSLKSKMATMHDDMGGAAAVIGAVRAIALCRLKINVVAVIAACKNMISGDAYVPGDILYSMNGNTIEMLNSDAEGRLTLVDAITYAIRREGAERIIDIATLTGAAKGAVGGRTAAVVSNSDSLYEKVWEASIVSCEKVWRLNADMELFPVLKSAVADIKNSNPGNTMGGGSIVAGLFIQEFVENKPWVHIDMAPVNWLAEENSYCIKGGTGYGVSLLYETVKLLAEE